MFSKKVYLKGSSKKRAHCQKTLAGQTKKGKSKHCLTRTSFKEYSVSFLMECRLIDFALVVLELFMFKVCGIIGISKIKFFDFSGTERVKHQKI